MPGGPQLLHQHWQGSGAGWLQVRASHSALLSGLSNKMVTPSIGVISPLCGLAV